MRSDLILRKALTTSLADLYATVGCHPTSTSEIAKRSSVDDYFRDLESVIQSEVDKGDKSRIVAIGEIGLGKITMVVCIPETEPFFRL
jgi:Tat protein secretion system quality control protein TatD with DNase activity